MDRRRFLGGSAAVGSGLLLGSCAADRSAAPPSTTAPTTALPTTVSSTTLSPTTTVAYDPATPYWLQGGFAPVTEEVSSAALVVDGALPPSLNGLYTRNGSNPAGADSPHWFFGDGMIHGVRF